MYRVLLVVATGLLVCSPAFSAETEMQPVEMGEVVVTAGRVVEKVQDQTMSVIVIDAEEIAASPARDLGDLLAEKGIAYIQKNPGALTTVAIRGFRTNAQLSNDLLGEVLVLLNGRRAGTGNLAMIMTQGIERVEIIRGPGAVQYGSAAMGGVINVITRSGKGPLNAEVSGSLGSFDFVEGGGLLSGDADKLDYSLGYSRSTMNDYRTAKGDKYRNTGFDAKDNYSINLGFKVTEYHRLGLMFNGTKIDKIGTPNYLSQNDLDDYRDSDYQAMDFSYEGGMSDSFLSWAFRYFETEIEDKSYDPVASNPDTYDDGGLSFKSKTKQQGAQAQISAEFDSVSVVTGVDWYDYDSDAESSFSQSSSNFENVAGFILTKSLLLDGQLIFDAGLRYDYFEVELVKPNGKTEDHDNLMTNFGVAYLLNDHWKLRAHYGEAFKVPGADQLAADYDSFGKTYRGNPNLDPESSRTYEAAIEYVDNIFNASLGYFYTRAKDKVVLVDKGVYLTWDNIGRAEISGVEAHIKTDFTFQGRDDLRLQPYANFTYFDRYRDLENDQDLMYMNEMNAAYGLNLIFPAELTARLNFAYHGRKVVDDWENDPWGGRDIEMGGFTVVDLGLTKRFIDSRCSVTFNVGNLFDKDYAYVKGYPMPGRNYQVGMRYSF